jgi:formiminotetrahydrofolate cyclodeaminase
MTELVRLPFNDLLREFAAPTPTPGGGSAAALAGAVGAALAAMVAGMTKTRTGSPAERVALDAVLESLLNGRDHLASLVDRDRESYDAVVGAYRMPKGSDEEKVARSAAIAGALRGATEVPLDVMRACHAVARETRAVAAAGNPSASSDVGVALDLLQAALGGAARNVRVNLKGLKDPGYGAGVEEETARLETAMAAAVAEARQALG